jgi:hypothetical protein
MTIKPKLHINIEGCLILQYKRTKPPTRECFGHSCVYPEGNVIQYR